MKSRIPSTRSRAIELLKCADHKTTPFHADIWPRFMELVSRHEEQLAEKYTLAQPNGPSIPEDARLSDIVFSQVPYRPRSVTMICTRYIFDAGVPAAVEVLQGVYDISSAENVSDTSFIIPLPEACRTAASKTCQSRLYDSCCPQFHASHRSATSQNTLTSTPFGSWPTGLAFSWKNSRAATWDVESPVQICQAVHFRSITPARETVSPCMPSSSLSSDN